jgi:hypothetical protein
MRVRASEEIGLRSVSAPDDGRPYPFGFSAPLRMPFTQD